MNHLSSTFLDLSNNSFRIDALHRLFADGVSVENVIDEIFRRIEAVNDPGIFISLLTRTDLMAQVEKLGKFDIVAKPLWGIPFTVKDNIDVASCETTAACPSFAYVAKTDATCVALLREAGAIIVGKTNLDQFATGLVGVRTPYPAPRNAIDADIVPGGSSSGSAVSVAHGIVSFSLGTDTAGSGRVPAALNDIVGLKPTLGSVSCQGVVPACRTLDTVSVFAQTVEDAWQVFSLLRKFDAHDAFSRDIPVGPVGIIPPKFQVAIPDRASRLFFGDTHQDNSFSESCSRLAAIGAEIIEIDFTPFYEVAKLLYDGPWVAERYIVVRSLLQHNPQSILPVTSDVIRKGQDYSAADAFEAQYRLKVLRRELDPVIANFHALCVPSIPAFCSLTDIDADPIGANARLGTYTNFVNLLDMCGITVPMQVRDDGRPGSITLLAAAGRDADMASLAASLQRHATQAFEAGNASPVGFSASISAEPEIEIAAVGAHMSGLPLNHELTGLGARFLRATKTSEDYRLYALAGGPPARPGLIRDSSGGAIDVEIWALPYSTFGSFMAGIPAPLSIGTVTLENGDKVKGFLCEPAGLNGAKDITTLGGWRAYLKSEK